MRALLCAALLIPSLAGCSEPTRPGMAATLSLGPNGLTLSPTVTVVSGPVTVGVSP